jgi:hypothetical protein
MCWHLSLLSAKASPMLARHFSRCSLHQPTLPNARLGLGNHGFRWGDHFLILADQFPTLGNDRQTYGGVGHRCGNQQAALRPFRSSRLRVGNLRLLCEAYFCRAFGELLAICTEPSGPLRSLAFSRMGAIVFNVQRNYFFPSRA